MEFSFLKKNLLTFGLESGECGLVDIASQSIFKFSKTHDAPAKGVAFSPFNRYLSCSCGMDQKIILYDVEKKKLVKVIQTAYPLCSISFKDDGVTLAVGTVGGRVLIYDLRKGSEPIFNFQASSSIEPINLIRFSTVWNKKAIIITLLISLFFLQSKPGKSLFTASSPITSVINSNGKEKDDNELPKSSSSRKSILIHNISYKTHLLYLSCSFGCLFTRCQFQNYPKRG